MIEKLQYITSARSIKGQVQQIIEACEAGVKWVQLRMKDANEETVLETAKVAKTLCDKYNAKLIINDHAHIAKSVNAYGVHIGKSDIPIAKAIEILGSEYIIGCTANTLEDIQRISEYPVHYIGLGPFRFTKTKKNLSTVLGLTGFKQILTHTHSPIPIIAIGGIVASDIEDLLSCGVHGIAVSSAISDATNKEKVISEMKNELMYKTKLT